MSWTAGFKIETKRPEISFYLVKLHYSVTLIYADQDYTGEKASSPARNQGIRSRVADYQRQNVDFFSCQNAGL